MRPWILAAAANGFLAVAMGAHAAHSLEGRAPPEVLAWVETGADYGLAHGLALLGVAVLATKMEKMPWALRIAGWAFLLGTLLFSGTLYVMGLTRWDGPDILVPFGGVSLMVGWVALFVFGLSRR